MFGAPKRGFRSMAGLILVRNVVGELRPKRTLAASRGFLAAARLSCLVCYHCRHFLAAVYISLITDTVRLLQFTTTVQISFPATDTLLVINKYRLVHSCICISLRLSNKRIPNRTKSSIIKQNLSRSITGQVYNVLYWLLKHIGLVAA